MVTRALAFSVDGSVNGLLGGRWVDHVDAQYHPAMAMMTPLVTFTPELLNTSIPSPILTRPGSLEVRWE